MNIRKLILVFIFMLVCILIKTNIGFGQEVECFSIEMNTGYVIGINSQQNVAENDTFIYINSCNNDLLSGNVTVNDQIRIQDSLKISRITVLSQCTKCTLSFRTDGYFIFIADPDYEEDFIFQYRICHVNDTNNYTDAKVFIQVKKDNDCDEVINEIDLDNDNDGILDEHEGNGLIDTDKDSIPDNFDIDSDNDGITDIVEWQIEGQYILPSRIDANKNGWDDAFDVESGGVYYPQTDTDQDDIPDYLDSDSDEDAILDYLEAFVIDTSGIASVIPVNADKDKDGLDDAFDIVPYWRDYQNSYGSCSPLPDLNKSGIRDWRENEKFIGSNISPDEELYLYPNPARNSFSVHIPSFLESQDIVMDIYDIAGKQIVNKIISVSNYKVEMFGVESGIFIVRYKTDGYSKTEKLILNQ